MLAERNAPGRLATWLLRGALAIWTIAVLLAIVALMPLTACLPSPWDRLPEVPCPAGFASAWLIALVGIGFAWRRPVAVRIGSGFAAGACSFMLYLYLGALPAIESYRTQRPFAEAVKEATALKPELALYGTREIVGLLDPPAPIAECHTPAELDAALKAGQVRWLLIRRRDWEELNRCGTIVLAETVHPWEDARGKLLLVECGAN